MQTTAFTVVSSTSPEFVRTISPVSSLGQIACKAFTACFDNGNTAGTPLFSISVALAGNRLMRADKSIHPHCSLKSIPCRKLVSIARLNAHAAYLFSLAFNRSRIRSYSPLSNRRLRARLPAGFRIFCRGLGRLSIPHSLRAISKR